MAERVITNPKQRQTINHADIIGVDVSLDGNLDLHQFTVQFTVQGDSTVYIRTGGIPGTKLGQLRNQIKSVVKDASESL